MSEPLFPRYASRRDFLQHTGMGIGILGLAAVLRDDLGLGSAQAGAVSPLAPKQPHFPAKAKQVVHIFAQGAPSHVDTWDPKPALAKHADQDIPGANGKAFPSPFKFTNMGKSGIPVSEVFPNIGQHVDEMAIIRSMYTDVPAHAIASVMMNTGSLRMPKPSLGSWVVYGLGSENQNMPGFITLRSGKAGSTANWQSAFLPGVYQGTSINTQADTVEAMIQNIRSPYLPLKEQRRQLDLVHQFNEIHSQKLQKDAQLEARIEAYEMAFTMQSEASDVFDLSKEPASVRAMYGNSEQGKQLLLARRLIQRGVRVVQIWAGGWDHHQNLETRLREKAREIDQPVAAFLKDLKGLGLLDSTLVVWGGEFGRKPTHDKNSSDNPGRDHNGKAFCTWMAGGGVKGGTVYGATDEFGAQSVQDKVHIHDLHATQLALLGFDHKKLTYRYNGRDFRLTDNFGNVVKNVIA